MKKFVTLLAAATLAFSAPCIALAAQFNSPSGTTVTAPSSPTGVQVSMTVSGDVTSASGSGYIDAEPAASGVQADNVPAGVTPDASFTVEAVGDATFTELTLTFSVGSQYAGANATVYITHSDGTSEARNVTVAANGTVSITVDRLSVFSIVVDKDSVPAGNQTTGGQTAGDKTQGNQGGSTVKPDTSATSPQTGVFVAPIAAVTAVATMGAASAAVALRKKGSK